MARIRTIKPEFSQSESMGMVSREARLCFILLWTIADDSGRLRGNSRMLASLLYPYDNDAPSLIDKWLTELVKEKCIIRYIKDSQNYIEICNWLSHQKIDKPSASRIPAFDESSRIFANPLEYSSEDQGRDQGEYQGIIIGPSTQEPEEKPRTPKAATEVATVDPLYNIIKAAFEKVTPRFTDYAKEGKAIHRIIKLTSGDREAIECMVKTFYKLTQTSNAFWSGQPFIPSALATGSIWDRVKVEAMKEQKHGDSWAEVFAKVEARV